MTHQPIDRRLRAGAWPLDGGGWRLRARTPRAVLLDAGFTLTFIDADRVVSLAAEAGHPVRASDLLTAESALRRELAGFTWAVTPDEPKQPASATASRLDGSAAVPAGGPALYRRLLQLAGGEAGASLDGAATRIWEAHLRRNLWSRVGAGVDEALGRLAGAGIVLAVVSNSEGTVEAMLEEVGLRRHLATVVDSWIVGVAKPDPRIFAIALDRLGIAAADAVMVGDSLAADIAGARAAGIEAALLDPLDLHPEADVPRFTDLPAFVDELLSGKR